MNNTFYVMKSVSGILDYVSVNNPCDKEYLEDFGYKKIGELTLDVPVNCDQDCKKLMQNSL